MDMDASPKNAADSVLPNIAPVLIAWENRELRLERHELQVMSTRAAEGGSVEYAEPFFA